MYCPNCGKLIDSGSKFCPSCGKQINSESTKHSDKTKGKSNKRATRVIFISILCIILILIVSILTYRFYTPKLFANEGYKALNELNINKATIKFEQAVEAGNTNTEVLNMYNALKSYKDAQALFDDGEESACLEKLNEVALTGNENVDGKISSLRASAEQAVNFNNKIETAFENIESLINSEKVNEAETAINNILTENLSDEQNQKVDTLQSKLSKKRSEITERETQRAKAEAEAAQKEREKSMAAKSVEFSHRLDSIEEKHDGMYMGNTNSDLLSAYTIQYNDWDKVLNEMYSYLKLNLSKDEFDKLSKEERIWLNEKNENSAKIKEGLISNLQGMSNQSSMTRERCYELLSYFN